MALAVRLTKQLRTERHLVRRDHLLVLRKLIRAILQPYGFQDAGVEAAKQSVWAIAAITWMKKGDL